ncbi:MULTISPECIES: type II toxin-antitoxin system ParD family antitoxin [unclassified Caulobacter]|uniref:type II toxin-antitoxin system ParD family antitoxin n=1 Tax=unclassified Caulobacter TaxID=2648921 RepID=UPI0006F5585B|nr:MULTISPECIES: type II toxin-antitoxin system ParD family antitoxin [unclassified Caulobacter]KQV62863.1 transcriptional regulator [Caulobacter sp. Root342]KQV64831.1 transcriptional regulator [Caulobacter sp. Root343]
MTLKVELSPDLERFVEQSVAAGRFANTSEAVSFGLRLLRDQDARKEAFMAMLHEAEAEAERDGYFTAEQVMAELDAFIDAVEAEKTAAAE